MTIKATVGLGLDRRLVLVYAAPLALLAAVFFVGRAAQPLAVRSPATAYRHGYRLEVLRVIDGDTLVARAFLPWGETSREITFRAADFDAWETSRRRRSVVVSDQEIEQGLIAKEWLTRLVKTNRVRAVPLYEGASQDRYGRSLASWYVETDGVVTPVAQLAREAGHVRE